MGLMGIMGIMGKAYRAYYAYSAHYAHATEHGVTGAPFPLGEGWGEAFYGTA